MCLLKYDDYVNYIKVKLIKLILLYNKLNFIRLVLIIYIFDVFCLNFLLWQVGSFYFLILLYNDNLVNELFFKMKMLNKFNIF